MNVPDPTAPKGVVASALLRDVAEQLAAPRGPYALHLSGDDARALAGWLRHAAAVGGDQHAVAFALSYATTVPDDDETFAVGGGA